MFTHLEVIVLTNKQTYTHKQTDAAENINALRYTMMLGKNQPY